MTDRVLLFTEGDALRLMALARRSPGERLEVMNAAIETGEVHPFGSVTSPSEMEASPAFAHFVRTGELSPERRAEIIKDGINDAMREQRDALIGDDASEVVAEMRARDQ